MRREREREDDGDVYYQLLVRLYKGRRFPQDDQSGRAIAFEGRFNGEVLGTDPALLVPDPVFNTELVWEYGAVKQRALKASEGSTLKLRCVLAGEVGGTGAKLIGFILLDLRSAAAGASSGDAKAATWVPLRGSKANPEVKVLVRISCKPMTPEMALKEAQQDRAEVPRGVKHMRGGGDAAISLEGDDATDMHEYDRQAAASPEGREISEGDNLYGAVFLPPAGAATLDASALERFSLALAVRALAGDAALDATTALVSWGGRVHQLPINGAIDPEAGPSDISEVLFADPDALVEVLARPAAQGGGVGVWLFAGRCPIGSGWAPLELSFADQAEVMGGGAVESEVAVRILPRAMPRALVAGVQEEEV